MVGQERLNAPFYLQKCPFVNDKMISRVGPLDNTIRCRAVWHIMQHAKRHNYSDIIMSATASQITGVSTQPFVRAQIKETIKAPFHWPLPVTGEYPAQGTSNAENDSISWRRHDSSESELCCLQWPSIKWLLWSCWKNVGAQKRKGRQHDCPGRHWRRWSLTSTSPMTARGVILTTVPF